MFNDKLQHAVGCAFITFLGFLLSGNLIFGAIIGVMAGLSKEIYDEMYSTGFDWRDLAADGLGVLITSLFLQGVINV